MKQESKKKQVTNVSQRRNLASFSEFTTNFMTSVDTWVHSYSEKPHDLERIAGDDDIPTNETNSTTYTNETEQSNSTNSYEQTEEDFTDDWEIIDYDDIEKEDKEDDTEKWYDNNDIDEDEDD